jgi:hypothetical protein
MDFSAGLFILVICDFADRSLQNTPVLLRVAVLPSPQGIDFKGAKKKG